MQGRNVFLLSGGDDIDVFKYNSESDYVPGLHVSESKVVS